MRLAAALFAAALLATPLPRGSIAADSPADVMRKDVQAIAQADLEALVALYAPDVKVFKLPADLHSLVGEPSGTMRDRDSLRDRFKGFFAEPQQAGFELAAVFDVGELAVAHVVTKPPGAAEEHLLIVMRVRDGLIRNLWHVAKADAANVSGAAALAVNRKLVEANNRGDVEAFLKLFSADAKNFSSSGDPDRIGDKPSTRMTDRASREQAFRAMFANGAPVQVVVEDAIALGDYVASHDVATRPDGKRIDEISIYRVRDGLIVDDWFVASVPLD